MVGVDLGPLSLQAQADMRTVTSFILSFAWIWCSGCGSSLGSRCVGVAPVAPPRTSYYQYDKDLYTLPDVQFRWRSAGGNPDMTYDIAIWKVMLNDRVCTADGNETKRTATLYEPRVFMDPDKCDAAAWWGSIICGATGLRDTKWRPPIPLRRGLYGWTVRLRQGDKVSGWCYAEEKGISSDGVLETLRTPFLFTVFDPNDPPAPPLDALWRLRRGFMWP